MCMTEYCQNLIFAVEQRFPHYFFIITPVSRYLYVLLFEYQVSLSYPRQNVGLPQHKQLNWFFTNGKYLQKDEIPLHVHQWTGRSICKLKMNGLNFEDECFSLAGSEEVVWLWLFCRDSPRLLGRCLEYREVPLMKKMSVVDINIFSAYLKRCIEIQ